MAIAVIATTSGTGEEADQMLQRLQLDTNPSGALVRLAGATENGWRIITVWESQDAWDTFLRERLQPALQTAGRTRPEIEIWPLHSVRLDPR